MSNFDPPSSKDQFPVRFIKSEQLVPSVTAPWSKVKEPSAEKFHELSTRNSLSGRQPASSSGGVSFVMFQDFVEPFVNNFTFEGFSSSLSHERASSISSIHKRDL